MGEVTEQLKEDRSPRWIAPICVWLCSTQSSNVTGRVFQVNGNDLAVAESWHKGPAVVQPDDPTKLGPFVAELMSKARLNADMGGKDVEGPGRPGRSI